MSEKKSDNTALNALREEIDVIDTQLHQLLMARDEVTKKVERAKGLSGGRSAMRPSREAHMMQRLKNHHNSQFSFASLEHIWRELIAVSTRKQSPFRVHMVGRSLQLRDLARFQFGVSVPLETHDDPSRALEAVSQNQADIALIPLVTNDTWWQANDLGASLKIIARIPYFKGTLDLPEAFLVARIVIEETGQDCTLARASEVPEDMDYEILASAPDNQQLLVELAGLHDEKALKDKNMHFLGAYPSQVQS